MVFEPDAGLLREQESKMLERVYFDTCALNRLTDDQSQVRISDEAEAVTRVFDLITDGKVIWIGSTLLRFELARNSDSYGREISLAYMELASEIARPDPQTYKRAKELESQGFGGFDALHLALAEMAGADWLFTVDDRFIGRALKTQGNSPPAVTNPLEWVRRRQPWLLKR